MKERKIDQIDAIKKILLFSLLLNANNESMAQFSNSWYQTSLSSLRGKNRRQEEKISSLRALPFKANRDTLSQSINTCVPIIFIVSSFLCISSKEIILNNSLMLLMVDEKILSFFFFFIVTVKTQISSVFLFLEICKKILKKLKRNYS